MRWAMKKPLLRIEWWVRQAAFGDDVVPDVNCMLTISSGCSGAEGLILSLLEVEWNREENGVVAVKNEVSIRPDELSTIKIFRNEGTDSDCRVEDVRSLARAFNSVTFSRGGL